MSNSFIGARLAQLKGRLARIRPQRWLILSLQLLLVFISLTFAWLLRFEFRLPYPTLLFSAFPILALMRLAGMARFNLLHGYWRYSGMSEAHDVVKAVLVGSAGFYLTERWILGIDAFPVSIYILEGLLTAVALGGVRIFSRTALQAIERGRVPMSKRSAVIVGAGAAGALLAEALRRCDLVLVGFFDDDRAKVGAKLCGVQVLGTIDDLPGVAQRLAVDEILIAVPSSTGHQMRRIVNLCHEAQLPFRTIPSLGELISGTVRVEQLREVHFEDLLHREPVHLASGQVHEKLSDKVVMVTGAAGSIGSELCGQILDHRPARLLCVDQDESGLFFLQQRLEQQGIVSQDGDCEIEYHIADITNQQRMLQILYRQGLDIVFHAAAYKHVPMMEANVHEAVSNNVFGLLSLLDVIRRCGCSSFVMISSDKAVNPTNVMGCTKRIGELILSAWPRSGMRCISVRFGNVLGSQGSVVPIFQEQICKHGRVTVTHPEITRFFMTISEAVSLVLQGFAVGKDGEILVLEMGEPMRIVDMARMLIKLLGKSERDVEITYTGLREGEKLYEELFYENEESLPSECEKVMRTRGRRISWELLQRNLDELRTLMVAAGSDAMIRQKLKQIVPEYCYREMDALQLPVVAEPHWALTQRAAAGD